MWTGAPLGVPWNIPTAAIQNAAGQFVAPSTAAAAAAAEADATLAATSDPTTNNLVTFNAEPTDAAAYNNYLMEESYLVVPTNGLAGRQGDGAGPVRSGSCSGPRASTDIEHFGAAPATAAMVTAGLKVAAELDAEAAAAPTTTRRVTTTTTDDHHGRDGATSALRRRRPASDTGSGATGRRLRTRRAPPGVHRDVLAAWPSPGHPTSGRWSGSGAALLAMGASWCADGSGATGGARHDQPVQPGRPGPPPVGPASTVHDAARHGVRPGRPPPTPARSSRRLRATNVSAWFGSNKVLERVSLTMEPGKVTALIGPSGAGSPPSCGSSTGCTS